MIWWFIAIGGVCFIAGIFVGLALDSIKASSESGKSRLDFVILLSLLVLVAAFVAWEIAGLTLPGFHTISFEAVHHAWLAYLIGALFVAGGAGGLLWWRHHLTTSIPK
jgi:hypothetical protein